jgi:hypothetical protein
MWNCQRRAHHRRPEEGWTWPDGWLGGPRALTCFAQVELPSRKSRRRASTARRRGCTRQSPAFQRRRLQCAVVVTEEGAGRLGKGGGVVGWRRFGSEGEVLRLRRWQDSGAGKGDVKARDSVLSDHTRVLDEDRVMASRLATMGRPAGPSYMRTRPAAWASRGAWRPTEGGLCLHKVYGGLHRRRPHGVLRSTARMPKRSYTGDTRVRHVAGAAGHTCVRWTRRRWRRCRFLFHVHPFKNAKLHKVPTKLKISK